MKNTIRSKLHFPPSKDAQNLPSISRRLTTGLILAVLLVATVVISVTFFIATQKAKKRLDQEADKYVSFLVDSLQIPLWNYEAQTAYHIGSIYSQIELIASLKIISSDGSVYYQAEKDVAGRTADRQQDIFYNKQKVGQIRLSLSPQPYIKMQKQLLWQSILMMVLVLLSLALATGFLFRMFLKKPLITLGEIVESYSSGSSPKSAGSIIYSEFKGLVTLLNDMNKKIALQVNELQEAEEKYRSIYENAADGIFQTTLQGKILNANRSMATMLGYDSPEEMREKVTNVAAQLYFDPADRETILHELEQNGKVDGFEIRLLRKDKGIIWTIINTRLVRDHLGKEPILEGFMKDITPRVMAEKALKESQQLLQNLIDNTTVLVHIKDLDGRYILVNKQFMNVIGMQYDAIIGKTPYEIFTKEFALQSLQQDREVIRAQKGTQFENQMAINGVLRTFISLKFPLLDVTNQLYAVAAISTDITDRKDGEDAQKALIEELEAKNAELERFTYTVSHDLKSPLITINSFLGFIEKDLASGNTHRVQEDIRRVSNAATKMKQLLDELLELSRIGRIVNPSEEVNLHDLAHEALKTIRGRLERSHVDILVSQGLPIVKGDKSRLREVLENLLDNAIKFMGNQATPRIEIGIMEEGGGRIFYIKDNGIGIKPTYHDRVFRLFERLNQDIEGTGIGLAIVKRIIELHGGRIWIESTGEGEGTTFCFTLPGGK